MNEHYRHSTRKQLVSDHPPYPQPTTSRRNGRTFEMPGWIRRKPAGLFLVTHDWSRGRGRRDFLETWQWPQAGRFGLASAAARHDQQRGDGSDKCGKNANHGVGCGGLVWNHGVARRIFNNEALPASCGAGYETSFRRLDISGLVRSGWGVGVAGGGKKCGGDGDKNKFHLWDEVVKCWRPA